GVDGRSSRRRGELSRFSSIASPFKVSLPNIANRVGSPCWSPHPVCVVGVRRCPTLPHTTVCSTIGAQGLSFRVRDGTGRFPLAMTAVTVFFNNRPPHRDVWWLLFQIPYSGRVFSPMIVSCCGCLMCC